jgi:hypothetical protein
VLRRYSAVECSPELECSDDTRIVVFVRIEVALVMHFPVLLETLLYHSDFALLLALMELHRRPYELVSTLVV